MVLASCCHVLAAAHDPLTPPPCSQPVQDAGLSSQADVWTWPQKIFPTPWRPLYWSPPTHAATNVHGPPLPPWPPSLPSLSPLSTPPTHTQPSLPPRPPPLPGTLTATTGRRNGIIFVTTDLAQSHEERSMAHTGHVQTWLALPLSFCSVRVCVRSSTPAHATVSQVSRIPGWLAGLRTPVYHMPSCTDSDITFTAHTTPPTYIPVPCASWRGEGRRLRRS